MRQTLRAFILWIACGIGLAAQAWAATAEYPLFTRLDGYVFDAKASRDVEFGSYRFKIGKTSKETQTVEGRKISLRYKIAKGQTTPGQLYIVRNFAQAAQQAGGEVLNESRGSVVLRVQQDQKDIWAYVSVPPNGNSYHIEIIEKAALRQEVKVNPVLDAIDRTGKAVVYIRFATASSRIEADSQPVLDDILAMLQQRPDLKLSIEGHTDSDGGAASNQTLSEQRAKAVQDALTARGIAPSRLRSKGFGMSQPLAGNDSAEGKSKNRRVELVRF